MNKINLLIAFFFVIIIALFLYSYTQVDLSLTLSRVSLYQTIEKGFQYIGYFNRPLSTMLYVSIVGFLFLFYFLFLKFATYISMKKLWIIVLLASLLLTFSYNAFSYDLFNYIFAAKVVVHYHQSPYAVQALQFPKDPMLSFMHWTHNTYQYGFAWLGMTLPFYFFGLGYFILTFYLFKLLATVCFLGSVYFLQKILHRVSPQWEKTGVLLYALNPLIIIEFLVSSHNDSSMMLLVLVGIYCIFQKKWLLGIIAIILSYFTKQVTILLLIPTLIYMVSELTKRKLFSEKHFLWMSLFLMVAAFVYVGWKIGIQPWYAIWFLPFCFIIKLPRWVYIGVIGVSLGLLLRYVPFLWQGDWNGMALVIMPAVTILTPIVFLLFGGLWTLIQNRV